MAVRARAKSPEFDASRFHGLSRDQLIRMYRTMYLSRRLDDREIQLKRQNKIFFQISGAGHEAILVAAGQALRPGHDWFSLLPRPRAVPGLGVTPEQMLLQAVGAKDDPNSGGRQMPSHWGVPKLNIFRALRRPACSSCRRAGVAEAALYFEQFPGALAQAQSAPLGEFVRHERDEMCWFPAAKARPAKANSGKRSTPPASSACRCIFLVEDNGYAISVPVELQTPGGNISKLVPAFPACTSRNATAPIPLASYEAMRRAVDYCRARKGPALVHAHVIRPYSHSLSDDEKLYARRGARSRGAPRSHSALRAAPGARRHSRRERAGGDRS